MEHSWNRVPFRGCYDAHPKGFSSVNPWFLLQTELPSRAG